MHVGWALVYALRSAWLRRHPHLLWETADVIVKRVGDEAWAARTDTREIIARSTDHAEVIQQAIDFVASVGGGVVFIADGVYTIGRVVYLRSRVSLIGAGMATELRPGNDTELLRGEDVCCLRISNMYISDPDAKQSTKTSVVLDSFNRVELSNLWFENCYNGILLTTTVNKDNSGRESWLNNLWFKVRGMSLSIAKDVHDVQISNVVSIYSGSDGIHIDGTDGEILGGLQLVNIIVLRALTGIYIRNYREVWMSNIIVDTCKSNGMVLVSDGPPNGVMHIYMMNIWSASNAKNGIRIAGTATWPAQRILMRNVYVFNNGEHGILVEYTMNSMLDVYAFNNGYDGIRLVSSNKNVVTGRAWNNSQSEKWGGYGLGLVDSSDNIVVGFVAFDDQSTKTQPYGVGEEGTSDGNMVIACDLRGNATGAVLRRGANTVIVHTLGYATIRSGAAVMSGDGSTTDFLIATHGLTPSITDPSKVVVTCTPASSDATAASPITCYLSDEDGDGVYESIRAKFANPPASGTDNVKVVWRAEYVG